MCNQGIGIDFRFIVQHSKNKERDEQLKGLDRETCYLLIADHYSGTLYSGTFQSGTCGFHFINQWLATKGLGAVPYKYVRMDLGGKLGKNQNVLEAFRHHGYKVQPTVPDSSHQNSACEQPHWTIGDSLWVLLLSFGHSAAAYL
jgi:hypothetical protein